jgi:hypothetical protein
MPAMLLKDNEVEKVHMAEVLVIDNDARDRQFVATLLKEEDMSIVPPHVDRSKEQFVHERCLQIKFRLSY